MHDDQPVLLITCSIRNTGLCAVGRWDSLFGYGNGDCSEGSKYRMTKCIKNGGWPYRAVNGFFSAKYRLYHGGEVDNIFWDPALGTPTEDPGFYSNIPKAILKVQASSKSMPLLLCCVCGFHLRLHRTF